MKLLEARTPRARILRLGVLFEGGLLAAALALGWLFGLPLASLSRPTWQGTQQGALALAPMIVLLLAATHLEWGPLRRIRQILDQDLLPLFHQSTLLDFVLIAALAGFGEEFLFRGVIQAGLARWIAPWLALAIASLLFGLAHSITPTYAVLAAGIGVYFGWIFLATGDLYVVSFAHGAYDLIALIYLLRFRRREALVERA